MPGRGPSLLPGVPVAHVLDRLGKAGGKEVESGKFASDESSAALAVNSFGWFAERSALLPPLPRLEALDWPATLVDVEYCARFPWAGGRHPWLDAVVETPSHLIGIESKRFEPFRDAKRGTFSDAYDRPVWGAEMAPFERMRDAIRAGRERFRHLDAVQLVKHAFGLVTDGGRKAKTPVLFYIHAEPFERAGKAIAPDEHALHRAEMDRFAGAVEGAAVRFSACGYREWLGTLAGSDDQRVRDHARAIAATFAP